MAFSYSRQHSRPAQSSYVLLERKQDKPIRRIICRIEDSPNDPVQQEESKPKPEPAPASSCCCNQNKRTVGKHGLTEKDLTDSFPRFGPAYRKNPDPFQTTKNEAWQSLEKNPHEKEPEVWARYLKVIRDIRKDAENTYASSLTGLKKSGLTPSNFDEMMILDGCFFLQSALHILAGNNLLEYPDQHPYFGLTKDRKTNTRRTISAMFFVGNQIPCVVLHKLMEQPFFQGVINKGIENGTWKLPLDLPRKVLYLLVVHPELQKRGLISSPGFFSKLMGRKNEVPHFRETPSDLLHALHCLVQGTKIDPSDPETEDALDIEAGVEDFDKNIKFPSATELQQKGIELAKAKGGIREIHVGRKFLVFPTLYVPPFTFDEDTKPLLQCLQTYEIQQKMCKGKREVNAYVRFMADLIQTQQDVKILERKGIVKVEKNKEKYRLPGILSRLASSEGIVLTQNLRLVKTAIEDYSPLPKRLVSLGLIFGLIEIVFTILQYFEPRGSN